MFYCDALLRRAVFNFSYKFKQRQHTVYAPTVIFLFNEIAEVTVVNLTKVEILFKVSN